MKKNTSNFDEISISGKFLKVPAIHVDNITIVVLGKWVKRAVVKSETWLDGAMVVDPVKAVNKLKREGPSADYFIFKQKLPDVKPKFNYHIEWDNIAAIQVKDFNDWWNNQISKWTRKNIRRSTKRGIIIKEAKFDAELIQGIVEINNATPFRNGRPFWHYGKTFDQVKKDYISFNDRSGYFGAYYNDELIGILKLIYMEDVVSIIQILSKPKHQDKRPANALISKAVEVASDRKAKYLVYGKYVYTENEEGALTEFKRRNAFQKYLTPTYYIPMNLKGWLFIKLRLHLGVKGLIPKSILPILLRLREKYYKKGLTAFK